ncbi:tetratricopeptide repeat protein [Sphingomonas nostoxanthinifaciens]|uniref:tetratricopeptide repeat protein n=1 Tax=Sphingomonas nostoxanthinifaciens TaxID=2872652 RepID=UPI001CC1DA77|nr:tetratricopeptide repeat protein [Sphingomonas nostoxanthinifaciens]UAK24910.1 tetratricopeptide repeat protein [Sphingomonas nostoxanthinifaciens]
MTRLRLGIVLLLASAASPAWADSKPGLDQRVDRVERELKAVQRKVFPGGAPAYSEPEIAAPAPQAAAGLPASAPLNDLTARVSDLERAVSQMTGRVEEAEHRLQIMSEQSARDRQEFDTRLKTLEAASAPPPALAAPAPAPFVDTGPAPARPTKSGKTTPPPGRPAKLIAEPVDETPAPAADAGAASGDPAEDAYMAGYRLWSQKKFADAETALKAVVAKYPKSKRASYAQNLLGRAYLDDGQPARAAETFAANYQTNPRGDRAPDSLYYLGQSLYQLKKTSDACRVYDELDSAYGDKVPDSLKQKVAAGRRDAKCK